MLAEIIYCPHNKCLQSLIALLLWIKFQTVWAVSNKTIGLFYCLARADGRYQGFALIGKNRVQMNESVIKATYRSSVLTATTQQIVKVTIDLAIWINVSTQ